MIGRPDRAKIAVVGLGNVLMGDDGAGVAALGLLQGKVDEDVVLAEVGTAALKAQALLEQVECVVAIDAVQAGQQPGSVYCFSLDGAEINACHSLHEMGIAGVLKLMPEESRPQVRVVGVEPESIELRMALSPTVQAALPKVAETVLATISRMRNLPATTGNACVAEETLQ
jgi:hydrogenase maturation protease